MSLVGTKASLPTLNPVAVDHINLSEIVSHELPIQESDPQTENLIQAIARNKLRVSAFLDLATFV